MTLRERPIIPIGIGYWRSDSAQDLPDPKEFIQNGIPGIDRETLIKYLLKGKTFISWLGFNFCRFKCGISDVEMGARCMTDGEYVWPEGLIHYIKNHQIWLPDSFISHSKSNSAFQPDSIDLKKMKLYDLTWWKNFTR